MDRRVDWTKWSRKEFWMGYNIYFGNCQHFLLTMMLSAKPYIIYPRWEDIETLKAKLVQNAPKMLFNPIGLISAGTVLLASDVVQATHSAPSLPSRIKGKLRTCPEITIVGLGISVHCPRSNIGAKCPIICNEKHYSGSTVYNECGEDRRWSYDELPVCKHEGCKAISLDFDDATGSCQASDVEGKCQIECVEGVEEATFHCILPTYSSGRTAFYQPAIWAGTRPDCEGGLAPQSYYFELDGEFCSTVLADCDISAREGCEVKCDEQKDCTGLNFKDGKYSFTGMGCDKLEKDASSKFYKRPMPQYLEFEDVKCKSILRKCSSPFRIGCEEECDSISDCTGMNNYGGNSFLTGKGCDKLDESEFASSFFFRKPHEGCNDEKFDFDDAFGHCESGKVGEKCLVQCWDGVGDSTYECKIPVDADGGHMLYSQPARWEGSRPQCDDFVAPEPIYPETDGKYCEEIAKMAPCESQSREGCESQCDAMEACGGLNFNDGQFTFAKFPCDELSFDASFKFYRKPVARYEEFEGKMCGAMFAKCTKPFRIACEEECNARGDICDGLNYSSMASAYHLSFKCDELTETGPRTWYFRKPASQKQSSKSNLEKSSSFSVKRIAPGKPGSSFSVTPLHTEQTVSKSNFERKHFYIILFALAILMYLFFLLFDIITKRQF